MSYVSCPKFLSTIYGKSQPLPRNRLFPTCGRQRQRLIVDAQKTALTHKGSVTSTAAVENKETRGRTNTDDTSTTRPTHLDGPREAAVPRLHLDERLSPDAPLEVLDDVVRRIVGHLPSQGKNTQNEGDTNNNENERGLARTKTADKKAPRTHQQTHTHTHTQATNGKRFRATHAQTRRVDF